MSHPFGVGNSRFRIGTAKLLRGEPGAMGCYRRDAFERFGLFDEEHIRNQDDEWNMRCMSRGGQLILTPNVVCYYYARGSLRQLWRMSYQGGYFKPLVVRKVKRLMMARQLAPPALVAGFGLTALLAPWSLITASLFAVLVFVYFLAVALAAGRAAGKHGWRCRLVLLAVFPIMHFAYGSGYLKGILVFWVCRASAPAHIDRVPLTR